MEIHYDDLFDESHVALDTGDFHRDHLFPYYRKASAALRDIDPEVALCFQPAAALAGREDLAPLDDPNALYVPHLYPRRGEDIDRRMREIIERGRKEGYPTLFAEYGRPDRPTRSLAGPSPWSLEFEKRTAELFDQNGVGCIRPWYAKDTWWTVMNVDGSEHTAKMDVLSRPYPQRTAGRQTGWSYDFNSRELRFTIGPGLGVDAPTMMFVPVQRHYPKGFVLDLDDVTLLFEPGAGAGLTPANDASRAGATFDAENEILRVDPRRGPMHVVVRPLDP
jgi:hypothetical protein